VVLSPAPADSDDLSRFAGYDVVMMTWTAAEAAAMATLLTPGYQVKSWYEYRYDIASWLPRVTGKDAPFNDSSPENARYYHSLGLYFPCTIGGAKVLLFKSGLHLAYDGPQTPVKLLVQQIVNTVKPKVLITTGTAGGIGATVKLSDVAAPPSVRFDCPGQFKTEPWAKQVLTASPLPAGALAAITPELLKVNAQRIANARATPEMWTGAANDVVTTDVFAFDDSTDYYGLQGLGTVVEMGDAMVGLALQGTGQTWHSVRNVSDPQIPNPNHNIQEADKQAAQIYAKYGGLTTAASLIASWAIVYAQFGGTKTVERRKLTGSELKLGRLPRR
jgi:nucleoside phosphorylase